MFSEPVAGLGAYDERAEAEIAVLANVVAMVDARLCEAARNRLHPAGGRALLYAIVIYELLASARETHGPDGGRLYTAPILDALLDDTAGHEEVTPLDRIVERTVDESVTSVD